MEDLKVSQRALRELVKKLSAQGLCNEQALGSKEWFERRDKQDYTRIAYAKNNYGIVAELYFMKEERSFCYV